MMKVQVHEGGDKVTIQVCGRLAEDWVGELEGSWRDAMARHPDARCSIDLRNVTFIDHTGERLLSLMHQTGAKFLTAGLRNREVVNQVTGGAK
jgi:hypothetical protein